MSPRYRSANVARVPDIDMPCERGRMQALRPCVRACPRVPPGATRMLSMPVRTVLDVSNKPFSWPPEPHRSLAAKPPPRMKVCAS